jgi:hypothetical protein
VTLLTVLVPCLCVTNRGTNPMLTPQSLLKNNLMTSVCAAVLLMGGIQAAHAEAGQTEPFTMSDMASEGAGTTDATISQR